MFYPNYPLSNARKEGYFIMYRTHTCGEIRKTDVDKKVKLAGWIQTTRDMGGIVFID